MEENILICQDTQEGILTAVYKAYEWKMKPEQTYLQIGEEENLRLFAQYHFVEADGMCAEKVARTIRRKFGMDCYESICYALASWEADKAQAVYRTIAEGLEGKKKGSGTLRGNLMEHLGNPYVRRVFELARGTGNEVHHLFGFVRFEETKEGILFAEIHPKNHVLPLLMPHFADRFPQENFVIRDRRRNWYGIHPAGREWFLTYTEDGPERNAIEWSQNEYQIQELFRWFVHRITIEERRNPELQRQLLPLRFRADMTEFTKK